MYKESFDTILDRMKNRIISDVDKSEGSFIHDALSPSADEFAMAYDKLDNVLKNAFGITAEDVYLDSCCMDIGITRKLGSVATGTAIFSGTKGTIIPADTIIQTEDSLQYRTITTTTIPNTTVTVGIESVEIGEVYNVPANVVTEIPVAITGVTGVTNTEITGGVDIESDESLRTRYLLQRQSPSTSGNLSSYIQWAKEIDGIDFVKVFPNWNGLNTVKVVCLADNRGTPPPSKLLEISSNIENKRPICVNVTVEGPVEKSIDIKLTPTAVSGTDLEELKEQIEQQINEYFKTISFTDTIVRFVRVSEAILQATDILDFQNLTINNGTANIALDSIEIPVVGAVQFI